MIRTRNRSLLAYDTESANRRRSSDSMGRLLWTALVVLVFAAGTAGADDSAGDEGHTFVGVKRCRTCHKKEGIGNQYRVWEKSKHSQAFKTLASEKAAKWAAEAGVDDPQKDAKCVKCHVTAYGVPAARLSKRFDPTLGVQCEACHGAGSDYRKKKIMIDRDLAISKGLIFPPKEDVCTRCHNDESPAWDPERYTLADGTKTGFDYEQAKKEIEHPVPEDYDPLGEGEAD